MQGLPEQHALVGLKVELGVVLGVLRVLLPGLAHLHIAESATRFSTITADMPAMTLQHSTLSCTMVKHHACQSLIAVSHMIACQQVGLQASMTVCKHVWGTVGATYRIMGLTKWEPI